VNGTVNVPPADLANIVVAEPGQLVRCADGYEWSTGPFCAGEAGPWLVWRSARAQVFTPGRTLLGEWRALVDAWFAPSGHRQRRAVDGPDVCAVDLGRLCGEIERFANRWGLLTGGHEVTDPTGERAWFGESFQAWVGAVRTWQQLMADVQRLRDIREPRSTGRLRSENAAQQRASVAQAEMFADASPEGRPARGRRPRYFPAPLAQLLRAEGHRRAERLLVFRQINEVLKGVRRQLNSRGELVDHPATLLEHVYLQYVFQGQRERACRHCGASFTPRRRDQVYCGEVCRVLAYRHRKERAPGGEPSEPEGQQ
jgi:hypothetical protein